MSENLTELERSILPIIIRDSHRPSAISRILKGRGVQCDLNLVIQALNSLEQKDLVERFTAKAWLAKSKAQDYLPEED
ncbi:MAG: hypothetical protein RTU92_13770 [Candidatus Thorarchaeota archaeon]